MSLCSQRATSRGSSPATRRGSSSAEWESWEETMEVLADPELMAALAESEEDVKAGRVYDWDEVKRDLGLA